MKSKKIAFFSHLDFNLYRFRLPLMKRLISEGAHIYAVAPKGGVADRFQEHGIEFVSFEIDRKTFSPLKAASTVKKLTSVLKKIQPDVLHCFTLRPNVYGALAGRHAKVPIIISTVTGLGTLYSDGMGLKSYVGRAVVNLATRFALKKVSSVIFQNPDDRQYYLDQNLCRSDQAHLIISSGIDPEEFSPASVSQEKRDELRKVWAIRPEEIVVTMISRLVASKGVREFLQSAKLLRDRSRFVLIGGPDPGNPSSILWKELAQYIDKEILIAPGRQDNIPEWLAASDIYVLPSYREGVPRTVLEAMAMGLPIVTTDAPGCRETVIEGENGFLVPPKDVGALARAVASLIDNPQLRMDMGKRSSELVVERFSSEKIVDQYISLYTELLSKKEWP